MELHPIEAISGVYLNRLQIIKGKEGEVRHGMKKQDLGCFGFGEAYFSTVYKACIKGWKFHHRMTLNIIVVQGSITFVVWDNRKFSDSYGFVGKIKLSIENYSRLTIPPKLWFSFRGEDKTDNALLNIADIGHTPKESECRKIDDASMPSIWDNLV